MKNYICIDIGGTSIKYGIINAAAKIITSDTMATQASRGGPQVLEALGKIIEHYQATDSYAGVCLSTAGMVDAERGQILYASENIPHYTGVNLKRIIEETYHLRCEVENDVNCAGLAESISGAAQGSDYVLMLTIGTGIGGSLILHQTIYHGFSSSACEIGYMSVGEADFETQGSTSALVQTVAKKKAEPSENWDGRRVFAAAQAGDDICIAAIARMVDVLGQGIANLCYVINPQVVVLGGGIMAQQEYLQDRLEAAVQRYLKPIVWDQTDLRFAKYRNEAGMLGAFYNFRRRETDSLPRE